MPLSSSECRLAQRQSGGERTKAANGDDAAANYRYTASSQSNKLAEPLFPFTSLGRQLERMRVVF